MRRGAMLPWLQANSEAATGGGLGCSCEYEPPAEDSAGNEGERHSQCHKSKGKLYQLISQRTDRQEEVTHYAPSPAIKAAVSS